VILLLVWLKGLVATATSAGLFIGWCHHLLQATCLTNVPMWCTVCLFSEAGFDTDQPHGSSAVDLNYVG